MLVHRQEEEPGGEIVSERVTDHIYSTYSIARTRSLSELNALGFSSVGECDGRLFFVCSWLSSFATVRSLLSDESFRCITMAALQLESVAFGIAIRSECVMA